MKKNPVRCPWVDVTKPDYIKYHDTQWGVPVHDDRTIFEFLVLESAQAGLSWYTILKKRENYRKAFDNFDPAKVALYDDKKIEQLMNDPGIVRNRLKILLAVNNARCFIKVAEEFGSFDAYIWRFTDGKTIINRWKSMDECPASTPLSEALSKDLVRRGFKFVGPKICYAHMQATGMVNDHLVDCFRWEELKNAAENG